MEVANRNPVNIMRGKTAPHTWHFQGVTCRVKVGDFKFDASNFAHRQERWFAPILIDSDPMISFRWVDGYILLNLRLLDVFDNEILVIDDGEMVISTDLWHVEFVGPKLIVREKPCRIRLELEYLSANSLAINRGVFSSHGVVVAVTPSRIRCLNNDIKFIGGPTMIGHPVGLAFGKTLATRRGVFTFDKINRYGWMTSYRKPMAKTEVDLVDNAISQIQPEVDLKDK